MEQVKEPLWTWSWGAAGGENFSGLFECGREKSHFIRQRRDTVMILF